MVLPRRSRLLPLLLLAAGTAGAQSATDGDTAKRAQQMRRLCETVSMNPADGREMARRAECVLSGVLPSPDRLGEARALSRAALNAGEPSGGTMLYLTFQADPANQYVRDGKVDGEAYKRLAARPMKDRQEQVEAIEGLGAAAGRNNIAAGILLAGYFHDTVAPRNVSRTGAMAALLRRLGESGPLVERFAREADAVAKVGPTKASVRAFMDTYSQALATARAGYAAQTGGKACEKPELKKVSSGDVHGAEYLPLRGNLVEDSFLVKGEWAESWVFQACGEEVPLKVNFVADGWGGATSSLRHAKND
jgi:hypothetical protein